MSVDVSIGLATVAGAVLTVLLQLIDRLQKNKRRQETIEDRINALTSSLQEASKVISQIEEEIGDRQQLAEKLRNDIETAKKVAGLHKGEVEAVAQVFRGELRSEGRRGTLREVIISSVFFVLGLVASYFLFHR